MPKANLRCINCGISTARMRRNLLNSIDILSVIREWISPRQVTPLDHVCDSCWMIATQSLPGTSVDTSIGSNSNVGHRHVCINCGRSLLRIRSHTLTQHSQRESHVFDVISEWIQPRQASATSSICHPCWQRADRAPRAVRTSRVSSDDPIPEPSIEVPPNVRDQIMMPLYARAAESQNRCFVAGCHRTERLTIPLSLRQFLLKNYNFYVPNNNRVCSRHVSHGSWDFLNNPPHNNNHMFTALQVQDLMTLNTSPVSIDFNNIENMPDHLVHYWFGRTKQQFAEILNEVPRLAQIQNGSLALAAYLIKLRTGDSFERISSLIQIPTRTTSTLISQARDLLIQDYVTLHLGLSHINREQIAQRNLTIPNGIYGDNDRTRAIVIADGTYVYVQKSSNYLYQKNTYSLHKYRNLVKMFVIVSTDGYIIEVLGPYPATTSDAEIMLKEFRDENQPLRRYFAPNDVFILDRGFRDSLSLLNDCGYRAYTPATVQEGETQLSTLDANRSRAVTICRWVIEVINGRFKRDYKIFRQEYSNAASRNLMKDFTVAAALINAFHPLIEDRNDAGEILNIINQKMFSENSLSTIVISNNLNRRRTNFQRINVENNNVSDFPRLTYDELILVCLGTYQIKQARSYYGEHIRANGTYTIEVCREVDSSLLTELSTENSVWLLRGKIQSRHIGRKIYFVYILVDGSLNGRDAILQHYCNCNVGKRTVGCCAHILSIIWYLGWARYQDNVVPPAQHLDNILITNDDVESN